jgi:hypothetical protein
VMIRAPPIVPASATFASTLTETRRTVIGDSPPQIAWLGFIHKHPRSNDQGLQVTVVAGARKPRESLTVPIEL